MWLARQPVARVTDLYKILLGLPLSIVLVGGCIAGAVYIWKKIKKKDLNHYDLEEVVVGKRESDQSNGMVKGERKVDREEMDNIMEPGSYRDRDCKVTTEEDNLMMNIEELRRMNGQVVACEVQQEVVEQDVVTIRSESESTEEEIRMEKETIEIEKGELVGSNTIVNILQPYEGGSGSQSVEQVKDEEEHQEENENISNEISATQIVEDDIEEGNTENNSIETSAIQIVEDDMAKGNTNNTTNEKPGKKSQKEEAKPQKKKKIFMKGFFKPQRQKK
ncbi:uncharacterized protein [Dendropsophus ebraccatus]|uniref:uncharacterized protein isoform X2 n=1 Tax=Dendropsophus ebraccatus TaxID=150705 RepID=UPI003831E4DA